MGDLYFLIFGIICALIGILILWLKIRVYAKCRIKINAVIESVSSDSTVVRGSTVHSYSPCLVYEVNGKKYKCKAPFSTVNENKYNVGDTIPLFINKDNPELCRFPGEIGFFIVGFLFLCIGLLFVVLYWM